RWAAAGALWIGLGTAAFLYLALAGGRGMALWLLAVVWATDIGAYAAGRSIGGPKLAPRLSPNKTWSGLAGGVASAALVGLITAKLGGGPGGILALVSAGLAVVAQIGDLAESLAKRHFGVKDSSKLIPGHGGLLDRLDGLLAASVATGSARAVLVPSLISLTLLVFVPDLGPSLGPRRNGVRVEVFSIGFGPELFGWNDRAGTRWKFSAIPFGGYVKMFGDADPASMPGDQLRVMTPEERAVSFHHKRLGQRAAVVAAGPLANFLFAIVALAVIFVFKGQPYTPPEVAQVQP